jgi:hypothetical protein
MFKSPADVRKKIGKEVFVVGTDGDVETGDIDVFDTVEELNEHLSRLNPIAESNITVIHGILTSAEYIPDDIGHGAFVIALDPGDPDTGAIFEVMETDPSKLADIVEDLVTNEGGSIYTAANELGTVTIEDVFIIYGYELTLGYSVSEDEVDEGIIEECKEIADVANKTAEMSEESEG